MLQTFASCRSRSAIGLMCERRERTCYSSRQSLMDRHEAVSTGTAAICPSTSVTQSTAACEGPQTHPKPRPRKQKKQLVSPQPGTGDSSQLSSILPGVQSDASAESASQPPNNSYTIQDKQRTASKHNKQSANINTALPQKRSSNARTTARSIDSDSLLANESSPASKWAGESLSSGSDSESPLVNARAAGARQCRRRQRPKAPAAAASYGEQQLANTSGDSSDPDCTDALDVGGYDLGSSAGKPAGKGQPSTQSQRDSSPGDVTGTVTGTGATGNGQPTDQSANPHPDPLTDRSSVKAASSSEDTEQWEQPGAVMDCPVSEVDGQLTVGEAVETLTGRMETASVVAASEQLAVAETVEATSAATDAVVEQLAVAETVEATSAATDAVVEQLAAAEQFAVVDATEQLAVAEEVDQSTVAAPTERLAVADSLENQLADVREGTNALALTTTSSSGSSTPNDSAIGMGPNEADGSETQLNGVSTDNGATDFRNDVAAANDDEQDDDDDAVDETAVAISVLAAAATAAAANSQAAMYDQLPPSPPRALTRRRTDTWEPRVVRRPPPVVLSYGGGGLRELQALVNSVQQPTVIDLQGHMVVLRADGDGQDKPSAAAAAAGAEAVTTEVTGAEAAAADEGEKQPSNTEVDALAAEEEAGARVAAPPLAAPAPAAEGAEASGPVQAATAAAAEAQMVATAAFDGSESLAPIEEKTIPPPSGGAAATATSVVPPASALLNSTTSIHKDGSAGHVASSVDSTAEWSSVGVSGEVDGSRTVGGGDDGSRTVGGGGVLWLHRDDVAVVNGKLQLHRGCGVVVSGRRVALRRVEVMDAEAPGWWREATALPPACLQPSALITVTHDPPTTPTRPTEALPATPATPTTPTTTASPTPDTLPDDQLQLQEAGEAATTTTPASVSTPAAIAASTPISRQPPSLELDHCAVIGGGRDRDLLRVDGGGGCEVVARFCRLAGGGTAAVARLGSSLYLECCTLEGYASAGVVAVAAAVRAVGSRLQGGKWRGGMGLQAVAGSQVSALGCFFGGHGANVEVLGGSEMELQGCVLARSECRYGLTIHPDTTTAITAATSSSPGTTSAGNGNSSSTGGGHVRLANCELSHPVQVNGGQLELQHCTFALKPTPAQPPVVPLVRITSSPELAAKLAAALAAAAAAAGRTDGDGNDADVRGGMSYGGRVTAGAALTMVGCRVGSEGGETPGAGEGAGEGEAAVVVEAARAADVHVSGCPSVLVRRMT